MKSETTLADDVLSGRIDISDALATAREEGRREARALEAIRTFPLPSQSWDELENYRRILNWLYDGGPDCIASLVIDLATRGPVWTQEQIDEAFRKGAEMARKLQWD